MPDEILTDEQLKAGYWFVTHKLRIKKALIVILIVFNAVIWGYVLYGSLMLVLNYQFDKTAMAGLPKNLASYQEYGDVNQFLPLDVIGQSVLALGNQRYDLSAQVENPNAEWAVTYLEYRFAWSGGQTEFKPSFILPGEKKFFLDLNVPSDAVPSDAGIEFQNVKYLKMTNRRDLPPGTEERFLSENVQFIPIGTQPLQGGKTSASSAVRFETTNKMPYNLWSVTFKAILYQGKNVVGVNSAPVPQFKSGEKRTVEMNWFNRLPQVTGVIIEPEVNLLDESVFMPME